VLKGKPGSKVTLTLKNEGKVKHNFDLDAQQIDQDIDPGKSATVTVTIIGDGVIDTCRIPVLRRSRGLHLGLHATRIPGTADTSGPHG
jgi:uncharacterized cupredoxin-like copper-binding protein